jgi:hypothetical protein
MTAFPKAPKPVRSEAYRRLVASLPCAICGIEGASQAAHPNAGKAKALKACDLLCFPLCHVGANGCHPSWDSYRMGGRFAQAEKEPALAASTQNVLRRIARHDSSVRSILERLGILHTEPA